VTDSRDDSHDSLLRALARSPSHEPPPTDPERVAHFRIVGRLGRGGMGIVYRAEDEKLRRMVALKTLPTASASEPERRARFMREARSAAALTHPNIATIYEVGEEDAGVYIAMELVEGETLRARIEREGGAIETTTALRIARGIARGLARAHAKGVVHRDLKPENVMLDADGEPKILDFGLARIELAVDPDGVTVTELSGEVARFGTPAYMSPEQVLGDRACAPSDVFSFGVILYEMLGGRRPFDAPSVPKLFAAILESDPLPLEDMPPSVAALVAKCLRRKPEERYASGRELLAAIDDLGKARVPVATRPRRTGVVLTLLAGAAVAALVWRDAATTPTAAPPPRPVAITEHLPPKSANPEAAAEYATALQALRDGAMAAGIDKLRHASELDRSFSAAQIRLILYSRGWSKPDARRFFETASQNRASLEERDRDLLLMVEQMVIPDVRDKAEMTRRARVAAARWPHDAEVVLLAGMSLGSEGEIDEALGDLDRALDLDPAFALALHEKAVVQFGNGDADGCLETTERCLALSSTAASCARRRADIFAGRGRCEDLEREARRAVSAEPRGAMAHDYLIDALVARRAPVEAVRDIVTTRNALFIEAFSDANMSAAKAEFTEGNLAVYTGRLGDAVRHELEAVRLLRSKSPTEKFEDDEIIPLYEEIGERAKAVSLAADDWKRSAASPSGDRDDSFALAELHLAGAIPLADFRRERETRATKVRAHSIESLDTSWIEFYARTAATPDDAREAIEARPRFEPSSRSLGPIGSRAPLDEAVGRVHLLAGDLDAAIASLRLVTGACPVLAHLQWWLRAHAELGEALAAKGDTANACAAYGVVLSYWGDAKPRSITADKSRAQMRRLGCAG
jgi:serine/threonine-protein kinase